VKKLFFVRTTISVFVPVCSRTGEEARLIAEEAVAEAFDIGAGGLSEKATVHAEYFTDEQPLEVGDDATVWGEAVPEEFDEVATLRAHLTEQSK